MARPRKMTTEQMISVVDSYYLARAEGNEKRLKCSLIAAYAVELGYQAEGYDFARNTDVREHIERIKCFAEVEADRRQTGKPVVHAYKSLDIDGFIRSNKENAKLAKALAELDAYWKRVYEYAEKTAAQNKSLMKEKTGHESMLKAEIAERDSVNADNAELSANNNKLVAENRYLRKMLRVYLYPAVANEILMQEKALKECDTQATEAAVRDMTEFSSPQSLRESASSDVELMSEEDLFLQKMWELCDE